eukprot:547572-Karenia_brevis.AAC.1
MDISEHASCMYYHHDDDYGNGDYEGYDDDYFDDDYFVDEYQYKPKSKGTIIPPRSRRVYARACWGPSMHACLGPSRRASLGSKWGQVGAEESAADMRDDKNRIRDRGFNSNSSKYKILDKKQIKRKIYWSKQYRTGNRLNKTITVIDTCSTNVEQKQYNESYLLRWSGSATTI